MEQNEVPPVPGTNYASGVFPIFSLGLQNTYQVGNLPLNIIRSWIFPFLFDGFHPLWNKHCRQYCTTLFLLPCFDDCLVHVLSACSMEEFLAKIKFDTTVGYNWTMLEYFFDGYHPPFFEWVYFGFHLLQEWRLISAAFVEMPQFLWLMSLKCATMPGNPTA